jgi:hypothetical protein
VACEQEESSRRFTNPPTTAPWVLNLYPNIVTTEGTSSATRQYCFDPATGFLRRLRVLQTVNAHFKLTLCVAFEIDPLAG